MPPPLPAGSEIEASFIKQKQSRQETHTVTKCRDNNAGKAHKNGKHLLNFSHTPFFAICIKSPSILLHLKPENETMKFMQFFQKFPSINLHGPVMVQVDGRYFSTEHTKMGAFM